jgi:hypothetical protein
MEDNTTYNEIPEWAKTYSWVRTKPLFVSRYLGCKNPAGEYKEVCYTKSGRRWQTFIVFKIKVLFFKLTHPHWVFK